MPDEEGTKLTQSQLQDQIDEGVAKAMAPLADTVAAKVEEALKGLQAEKSEPTGDEADPVLDAEAKEHDGKFGFKSMGGFLKAVHAAGGGIMDNRLAAMKAASGMGENVGSDGGFLVPGEFSTVLWQRSVDSPESLIARTDSYPIVGNRMTFPQSAETSRKDGARAGGVQGYWLDEGTEKTASKPTVGKLELNLHKHAVLIPVTDELLEDSSFALESYVGKVGSEELTFMTNNSLIRGTGAGMPLGILNAPVLITVDAEPGQAVTTIVAENISKMWSRMYAPSRRNAIWLINQDIEPEMDNMAINVGTGGLPVYLPAGGYSASPYSTLKGRPVIPVEWCSTLGTVGDIILCDWSQYVTLTKAGGIKTDVSMHVRFVYDEQVFRLVARVDGQPWWAAPLTPYQGTVTQSPFVALASRP